jgi:hypothetical protein
MISLGGWPAPTRIIGLFSYSLAAIACGIAWAINRKIPRASRLAVLLAALEAALFLDMAFNTRWQLHDLLEGEAIRENLYSRRVGPQLVVLGLLVVSAASTMGLAYKRFRGRTGATLAACGVILSLSCWCSEVISLHATDTVFYLRIGEAKLVSLCWLTCSLMTVLGILWDAREARFHVKQGAKPTGKALSPLTDS